MSNIPRGAKFCPGINGWAPTIASPASRTNTALCICTHKAVVKITHAKTDSRSSGLKRNLGPCKLYTRSAIRCGVQLQGEWGGPPLSKSHPAGRGVNVDLVYAEEINHLV